MVWSVEPEGECRRDVPKGPSAILTMRTDPDIASLARVTNVFERRGLMPTFLSCRHVGSYLIIEAQLASADSDFDPALLDRLRALVCVDRADYVGAVQ